MQNVDLKKKLLEELMNMVQGLDGDKLPKKGVMIAEISKEDPMEEKDEMMDSGSYGENEEGCEDHSEENGEDDLMSSVDPRILKLVKKMKGM
jgi:hypothetical protein